MTHINALDPLNLHHVLSENQGSIFVLLHVTIQFDQQYLLMMPSFLQCLLLTSVKNQVTVGMWASVWVLSSTKLINVSALVAVSCSFVPLPIFLTINPSILPYCNSSIQKIVAATCIQHCIPLFH